MPIPEERLQAIRTYLREAFPEWQLADKWDGDHECHAFRLTRRQQPVHLLRISRNVLEDNEHAELAVILAQRNVAERLQVTDYHRLLLTAQGLVELGAAET